MQALDKDAVDYLKKQGLRITSDNLNRAMSFLRDNPNLREPDNSGITWNKSPAEEQFSREADLSAALDAEAVAPQQQPASQVAQQQQPAQPKAGQPQQQPAKQQQQPVAAKQQPLGERIMRFVGDNPQIGTQLMLGGGALLGAGVLPGLVGASGLGSAGLGALEQQLLQRLLIKKAATAAGLM